ncbi:hypothetical protein OGM63_29285 [Plectonema radiosum NIES-515]|uniref:Uncharacterized protein n=1 Tax=Plectonema radiosum NIES-515 TaxID=2986073 RepID=A0ABT3B8J3_9CYAN|nr:hypothetical protein [Plectonema radiosum]MCV3217555.1 hypothetical protein [Plectonema radiosum NIES-515]
MSLDDLEQFDIDTLVELLLRSEQYRERIALCINIGIDHKRLNFLENTSERDFFIRLIHYLKETGNNDALCNLSCKELLPTFRTGRYAPILSEIAVKLGCNQEFIGNSNNDRLNNFTSIEKIVKPKSKLLIGRASFLFICALGLSAISTYLWFPDIWSSVTTPVKVNAQSDPWLAGMPPNSKASSCPNPKPTDLDSIAPQNSPTEVKEIPLKPGSHLTFKVLEGKTRVFNEQDYFGPEGDIKDLRTHRVQAENGISNIQAPINSLVGVFLGREQPNKDSAPSTLFFSEEGKQNYLKLYPQLKQVFFIGDGRTNMGIQQRVIVPLGATRFYLGIMDSCNWRDTDGYLDVEVSKH